MNRLNPYAGRALIKYEWELRSDNSAHASCSDATMEAAMALRECESSCHSATKNAREALRIG